MQHLPQRSDALEIEDTGTDVLVHNKNTEKIHILNRTAGEVLLACDGKTELHSIAQKLNPERPAQAKEDIANALTQFSRLGLLSA